MVIRLPMAYCFDQKRVKKRIRQWTESEKFGGRVEVSYLPMLDVVVSVIWPIVVYRKRTVLTTKRGGEQKKPNQKNHVRILLNFVAMVFRFLDGRFVKK